MRGAISVALICVLAGAAVRTDQATRTARISGVVVEDDVARKPIARAVVTLTPPTAAASRSTLTDERGAFTFAEVVEGRYTVSATKAGYLAGSFGAARPGDAAVPLVVAGEPAVADVVMTRSAAISGFVRDRRGEPMSGAPVTALRWSFRSGEFDRGVRALRAVPGVKAAVSDARGAYRLYDLPPGDYVVMIPERVLTSDTSAVPVTTADDVERARQMLAGRGGLEAPARSAAGAAFAQTFHPGTAVVTQAVTVRVVAGDDRAGIDIAVNPEPTFAISGVISDDEPFSADKLPRIWAVPVDRSVADYRPISATVKADGTFVIPRMFPGTYILNARGPRQKEGFSRWARVDATVAGADVKALRVALSPTTAISGRIHLEGDGPLPPSPVRFSLFEVGETSFSDIPAGASAADGTFVISGVTPSRYRFAVQTPAGWTLKSIRGQGDVDYVDAPITVPEGSAMPPIDVTFTRETQSVSGTLQDSTGLPATSYTVVVCSAERRYWTVQTRRVAAARPGTDGSFSFPTLPAGEYLMAAVTGVEDQQWFNPEFLSGLVGNAIKVSIPAGAKVVQDIRISK